MQKASISEVLQSVKRMRELQQWLLAADCSDKYLDRFLAMSKLWFGWFATRQEGPDGGNQVASQAISCCCIRTVWLSVKAITCGRNEAGMSGKIACSHTLCVFYVNCILAKGLFQGSRSY